MGGKGLTWLTSCLTRHWRRTVTSLKWLPHTRTAVHQTTAHIRRRNSGRTQCCAVATGLRQRTAVYGTSAANIHHPLFRLCRTHWPEYNLPSSTVSECNRITSTASLAFNASTTNWQLSPTRPRQPLLQPTCLSWSMTVTRDAVWDLLHVTCCTAHR